MPTPQAVQSQASRGPDMWCRLTINWLRVGEKPPMRGKSERVFFRATAVNASPANLPSRDRSPAAVGFRGRVPRGFAHQSCLSLLHSDSRLAIWPTNSIFAPSAALGNSFPLARVCQLGIPFHYHLSQVPHFREKKTQPLGKKKRKRPSWGPPIPYASEASKGFDKRCRLTIDRSRAETKTFVRGKYPIRFLPGPVNTACKLRPKGI